MTSPEDDLRRWAAATWRSLDAMTDPATGLPADHIGADVEAPARSGYTSPTNIGGYLWSAVVARDLGLITAADCADRLARTLRTLTGMLRHRGSGMFYNWYDEATGRQMLRHPESGEEIAQFLSSVDNGWLAAALLVVRRAEPTVAGAAAEILRDMDFGACYDPGAINGVPAGLLRGGFWERPPTGGHVTAEFNGVTVYYTGHHYGPLNSEPRIASYIGILRGQIPDEHYFAMTRGPADPGADVQHHLGIPVAQGSIDYRGLRLVPTWGGSMFEALMPDLFVPEATWGPKSFGINHPLTVRAQREFGLDDAGYGYWGFSPASKPGGGYSEWGAEPIGTPGSGYPSDLARTRCSEVTAGRAVFDDGVITPHALFLALGYEPDAVLSTLRRVESDLRAYGDGGFFDAVAVRSALVAKRYLSLDQSMIMAALGNHLCDNNIRTYFCTPDVELRLRPLLALESFAAGELAAGNGLNIAR